MVVELLQFKDSTKGGVKWQHQMSAAAGRVPRLQTYFHSAIHFCANFSFAALSKFLPTIAHDLGHDAVHAQELAASAYSAAFLLCLVIYTHRTSWAGADSFSWRPW